MAGSPYGSCGDWGFDAVCPGSGTPLFWTSRGGKFRVYSGKRKTVCLSGHCNCVYPRKYPPALMMELRYGRRKGCWPGVQEVGRFRPASFHLPVILLPKHTSIHPKNRRISIHKMDGDTAIIAIKWVLYFPIPFSYSLVDPPKAYRTGIAMFAAVCSFSLFSSRRTAASAIWGIGWTMVEQT